MSMEHILTVRLEETDMEKLRRDALATERSVSDHIRLLIRMPIELSDEKDAILVFNLVELGKVELQVRRWGLSFNQSVRVMNYLAKWVREGGSIDGDFITPF